MKHEIYRAKCSNFVKQSKAMAFVTSNQSKDKKKKLAKHLWEETIAHNFPSTLRKHKPYILGRKNSTNNNNLVYEI